MKKQAANVRERIIQAAANLLAQGGRAAASTRAVSAAAGVQAPTIYRLFGDMRGLLDVVAQTVLAGYVHERTTREYTGDVLGDLRRGWDQHVAFGLAHPAVYSLIFGDPAVAVDSPVVRQGFANLRALVSHAAEAGWLRVSVPHAVQLIAAAGQGVTFQLLAVPLAERDPQLSATMREAVIAAITVPRASDDARKGMSGPARVAARAVALHAVLVEAPGVLSAAEGQLLGEWLDRLSLGSGTNGK